MQVQLDQIVFMFLIPYGIWVTMSLFNQRQELALLRLTLNDLAEAFKDLKKNSCSICQNHKKKDL